MVSFFQPEFPDADFTYMKVQMKTGEKLLLFITPAIILHFLYVITSGCRNPKETSDSLCVFSSGKKQSRFQPLRTSAAVCMALLVYVFGILFLIMTPLVFVPICFYNEMNILYLPQSESLSTIGQWSPCVSTTLIISAAIISKYGDTWHHCQRRFGCRLFPQRLSSHRQNPSTSRPFHSDDTPRKSPARHIFPLFTKVPLIFHSTTQSLIHKIRDFHAWVFDPIHRSLSNLSQNPILH